ncbi:MAG: BatD family protein [Methanosarcina flavescens]|uniref:DUF11 domain-containing protein n=1 Tax=Methanosarcina flavescens TaxID=1715806 RepID=A0A660HRB3_9EURY|nr:BatD family protein [Methanosarcina flavescens]AYK14762.1 DUF11 domain-containing protein [Methanosarcina flavescens]NLK33375.1 DUF11 domain-containing protein [Methanosarcina flavescens]
MKLKKIHMTLLLAFFILLESGSTASAKTAVYEGNIKEGQAYQLNNYIIEFTDIFPEANTASYYVYEKDREVKDGLLGVNKSADFSFEKKGKVEMRLKSVHGGRVATVVIMLSNYNPGDLYINKLLENGRSEAVFAGDPEVVITKSIDKSKIKLGETVTVTVKAKNTGNDTANNVTFMDPKQEHFVLEETVYEVSSTIPKMEYGESVPETLVYIYKLKATDAGTFDLKAVNASYTNSAGQIYQTSSNMPSITVSEGNKLHANVEARMNVDSLSVERNEKIVSNVILRNTGNAPAQAVRVDILLPENFEYVEGEEGIESVGGTPRIYIETLEPNNDKEFTYTLKAKEVGTYNINSKLSYEYNNGIETQNQKVSNNSTTLNIYVKEGKFDFLIKNPLYIVVSTIILAAVSIHIYKKHKEYRY